MNYKKEDINDLYLDFYSIVNKIIYKINNNKNINKFLYYCNYEVLNSNNKQIKSLPISVCLGGGGFMLYNIIFKNENITKILKIETLDYDVSYSLKHTINDEDIEFIKNEIINICNTTLSFYKFKNLTGDIFKVIINKNNDQRIHIKIDCNTKVNTNFHILELSMWFNGKVSDNFTINDFISKNNLYLYNKNNIYYYLLPLELLIKTMLYAITDFFERRYFEKCIKYIERVKFIKEINDIYQNSKHKNECMDTIFSSYFTKIKRKYKIINDYPYIYAYKFVKIDNNGIIKCIYKNLRKNNRKTLDAIFDKYMLECKDMKKYNPKYSEDTEINTEI